jgi:hypothetical protein
MARVLVSLISKETMPNILFIKEMKDVDQYLFISTQKMENPKRTEWIINSLKIPIEKVMDTVIVDEFSFDDIFKKLSFINFDNEYIINITGGTKVMSQAVYDFFKEANSENSRIVYIIGEKNKYIQLHPRSEPREFAIVTRIGLLEYLEGYGFSVLNPDTICSTHNIEYSKKLFTYYLNGTLNLKILSKAREMTGKARQLRITDIPGMTDMLEEIHYPHGEEYISKADIKYLNGGWFEEYVYTLIKDRLMIEEQDIGINVTRQGLANEFDVMFIKKNQLHIVECKTNAFIGGVISSSVSEILYKNDALREQLGLLAHSYLFTLSSLRDKKTKKFKDEFKARADFHRVILVDKDILTDEDELNAFFSSLI